MADDLALLQRFRVVVPALTGEKHKGQAGKIAVVGGCREYTGAPYFSAFTALRVGADLSHVFCTEGAATVIKSYAPDLIVHPYLPDSYDTPQPPSEEEAAAAVERAVQRVEAWLDRFDALVVGPGLGRDDLVLRCVGQLLERVRARGMPLVLDGDGLYLATQRLELLRGWKGPVLTPNVVEFKRLAGALGVHEESPSALQDVCRALGGPLIVRKGRNDIVCDGDVTVECSLAGSPRRCGGQGDVLSGSTAVFCAWAAKYAQSQGGGSLGAPPLVAGAYLACHVSRTAAALAYARHKRSMVTADVLAVLPDALQQLFPVDE